MDNKYPGSTTTTMQSTTQSTAKVTTLYNAIEQLNEISWSLNNLVFGGRSADKPQEMPIAGDKLTQARNQLQDITERLREIRDRLEIIGE